MSDETSGFDILEAIKDLSTLLSNMFSRAATYAWLEALHGHLLTITASKRLQAELEAEYDRCFQKHPRATPAWRFIKLCARETDLAMQTGHRWAQCLEVALDLGWSNDEFGKRLREINIDGILKQRPATPRRTQPTFNAAKTVKGAAVAQIEIAQTSHQLDLVAGEPRVLIVVRVGDRVLDIAKDVRLTAQLLKAIERAAQQEAKQTDPKARPSKAKARRRTRPTSHQGEPPVVAQINP